MCVSNPPVLQAAKGPQHVRIPGAMRFKMFLRWKINVGNMKVRKIVTSPKNVPRTFETRAGSKDIFINMLIRITQRKLVYPSTGRSPTFQTSP